LRVVVLVVVLDYALVEPRYSRITRLLGARHDGYSAALGYFGASASVAA